MNDTDANCGDPEVLVADLIRRADAAIRRRDPRAATRLAGEADALRPHDPMISTLKVHIARHQRSRPLVRELVDAALSRWFDQAEPTARPVHRGRARGPVRLAHIADVATPLHYIDHVKQVITDQPEQPSAQPTFFGLRDGMVLPDGDWTPLTGQGELLIHGMGINPRLVKAALGGKVPRVDVPVKFHADGRIIVIGTNDNWYHFVLDYLPRLIAVLECGLLEVGWRVALGQDARDFFAAILEPLGIPEDHVIWLDADHAHHFPRAIYISNMGLAGLPHQFALALLRRYMMPKLVDTDAPADGPKRLFVGRTDAAWRRMQNEAELHEGLADRGFRIFRSAGLTLERQIELFRSSELVVGVHGAGLVNVVWASKPPMVIELSPHTSKDTHFSNLVRQLGGRHWRLRASERETAESGANRSNFVISGKKVFRLIDRVIDEMAL